MLVLHLTSQKTNSQKEHSLTIWLPYLFLDLCVFVDVNEIFPLCPTETIGCNMLLKTTTRQFACSCGSVLHESDETSCKQQAVFTCESQTEIDWIKLKD